MRPTCTSTTIRKPPWGWTCSGGKAYGLAGLRLGYAIGAPELIAGLRKVAIPFAVTALAQEAGLASLKAEKELQKVQDKKMKEIDQEEAQTIRQL